MGGLDIVSDDEAARAAALAEAERRETAQTEDFDEFWAQTTRTATSLRNVFGVDVTLPAALPLAFEVQSRALKDSKNPDDTKRMVGLLFGADALDRWTAAGMDLEQFSVLLLWGTVNTRHPNSMTLAEALEVYRSRLAGPGKAEGETTPPEPSGDGSSATGRPSRRTSAGSTGSRKKASRT